MATISPPPRLATTGDLKKIAWRHLAQARRTEHERRLKLQTSPKFHL
ncbi:hypothetical protein A2U01_0093140, partial [Trifolium medium]|nr:hypothetical protein [Trifolium medium]